MEKRKAIDFKQSSLTYYLKISGSILGSSKLANTSVNELYLKPGLMEIAKAVEKMVLPTLPSVLGLEMKMKSVPFSLEM